MKQIFLSLDDLHKLYGISPAVVNAIKKKRKRRRKKNKKINNGTMGDKPSSSEHMAGYMSLVAIEKNDLKNEKIDKHIKSINENNKRHQVDNEPFNDPDNTTKFIENTQNNLHPNDPDIKFIKYIKEGIASGDLKHNITKTGFSITDKTLGDKKGRKKSSGKVIEIKTPQKVSSKYVSSTYESPLSISARRFERDLNVTSSTLSDNGSHNMDRSRSINVMDGFIDDNTGALNLGTSSDGFTAEEAQPVIDPNEKTIEVDDETDASALPAEIADNTQGPTSDELDALFEAEQQRQLDEEEQIRLADEQAKQQQNALDLKAQQKQKAKPIKYAPRPITDYTSDELKQKALTNGIKVQKINSKY
jgi:hypothetical protein